MRERWTRRWAAPAAVTTAALLLAGCSGTGRSEGGSAARSGLPQPASADKGANTAPPSAGAAALTAYRSMWEDAVAASEVADPDLPRLDDHASAGALRLLKYGMEKARKEQVITKGAPHLAPEVVTANSEQVTLRDCVDGTKWLQYKKSGGLKNDVPGGHSAAEATVRLQDGVWKVSDLYLHQAGSC
jgi:hypothetical protein